MRRVRVIPILLLQGSGLVKTRKFSRGNYIGDPINAVKIFNDKEVDELSILDIEATKLDKSPNFSHIEDIVSEAFMPIGYGGGLKTLDDIKKAFDCGIEKVILNTVAFENTELITKAANIYGAQSVVVSIDVNKNLFGKKNIYISCGNKKINIELIDYIKRIEGAGAGEIVVTAIYKEGMQKGYDLDLIKTVSNSTNLPVVANGGANSIDDFVKAVKVGASAVAAGSKFVYTGQENGILINYPSQKDLKEKLFNLI